MEATGFYFNGRPATGAWLNGRKIWPPLPAGWFVAEPGAAALELQSHASRLELGCAARPAAAGLTVAGNAAAIATDAHVDAAITAQAGTLAISIAAGAVLTSVHVDANLAGGRAALAVATRPAALLTDADIRDAIAATLAIHGKPAGLHVGSAVDYVVSAQSASLTASAAMGAVSTGAAVAAGAGSAAIAGKAAAVATSTHVDSLAAGQLDALALAAAAGTLQAGANLPAGAASLATAGAAGSVQTGTSIDYAAIAQASDLDLTGSAAAVQTSVRMDYAGVAQPAGLVVSGAAAAVLAGVHVDYVGVTPAAALALAGQAGTVQTSVHIDYTGAAGSAALTGTGSAGAIATTSHVDRLLTAGADSLQVSGAAAVINVEEATQIQPIDACTPVSGLGATSLNLGLPASAQVGDVVVASLLDNGTGVTYTPPAGAAMPVSTAFSQVVGGGGVLINVRGYLIRLTSNDIANGYVQFEFVNAFGTAIRGIVLRNVSETMLDGTAGVYASSGGSQPPVTFSAPGITTEDDGDMLVAVGIGFPNSGTEFVANPSGYTVGDQGNDTNYLQSIGYLTQASAGATGSPSWTFGTADDGAAGACGWIIALRRAVPAITLAADPSFPASLHVGDTGSFNLIATLADGATGSLTITAENLPDGMTLGSTTDNGDGTFSATVSYDLTTEQDVTATFSATGGSVAATPLTHEFVVQTQVTTPVPAQYARAYTNSSSGLTFGASSDGSGDAWTTPQAGSVLLLVFAAGRGQVGYSPGPDWNVIDNSMLQGTSGTERAVYVYWKYADGTESTVSIASGSVIADLFEVRGANASAPINKAGGTFSESNDATVTFGPQTPTVGGTLAIGFATWRIDPGATATTPEDWTQEPPNNLRTGSVNLYSFVQPQDNSLSAVSGTTTISDASTTDYGTYLILIAPP